MNRQRLFFRLACGLGAIGVVLGALGAHGMKPFTEAQYGAARSIELMELYKTGVFYHLIHALALLIVASAGESLNLWTDARAKKTALAGWLWTAGILLFSGSLYLLAVVNQKWLGQITPFGGIAFIAGWVVLLFAAKKPAT